MYITMRTSFIMLSGSVLVLCTLHRPLELADTPHHLRSHNEYGTLPTPRPRPHVDTTTENPYATLRNFRMKGRLGPDNFRRHQKKPPLPPNHPKYDDTRL